MNVFNKRILTDIVIEGPQLLRLVYDDNSYSTHNVVVWSTDRFPDIDGTPSDEGFIHMSQDGAIQGIGFLGFKVTAETPLTINEIPMESIDEVRDYLIANL